MRPGPQKAQPRQMAAGRAYKANIQHHPHSPTVSKLQNNILDDYIGKLMETSNA